MKDGFFLLPTDVTCCIFDFLRNGHDNEKYRQRLHHELIQYHKCSVLQKKFKHCPNCHIEYDDYFFYIHYEVNHQGTRQKRFHKMLMFEMTEIPNLHTMTHGAEPYEEKQVQDFLDHFYKSYGSYKYIYHAMKNSQILDIHDSILQKCPNTFTIKFNDDYHIVHSLQPIMKFLLRIP